MSKPQSWAGLLALAVLFGAGIATVHEFLPALIWAVIIAIGIWPGFERAAKRWPAARRRVLPALTVAGVFLTLVLPVVMIAVPLAQDAHAIAAWVDQSRREGIPPPPVFEHLPFSQGLSEFWRRNIGQPGELSALVTKALHSGAAAQARRLGAATLHVATLIGFMMLTLFLLLCSVDKVVEEVTTAARRAFGPAGEAVGRQMILSVHGTINGLVLVGLVEGVVLGVAYALVGLPSPTLFATLTAILAMAPFGATVAVFSAALVLLAVNKVIGAVIVVGLGSVVTFVADHFARPALIGSATELPFLWVLLGILGGIATWGLMGLFLGPAILAALMLIWREWVGAQDGPISPEGSSEGAAG